MDTASVQWPVASATGRKPNPFFFCPFHIDEETFAALTLFCFVLYFYFMPTPLTSTFYFLIDRPRSTDSLSNSLAKSITCPSLCTVIPMWTFHATNEPKCDDNKDTRAVFPFFGFESNCEPIALSMAGFAPKQRVDRCVEYLSAIA